jgi:hypothetical protein
MARVARSLLLVLLLSGGIVTSAAAQDQLKIIAPPPAPPEQAPQPEFVIQGQPPQLTRPREQDFYPDRIRSRHDPAFIAPFTATIPTGPRTGVRVGLSGWTAPAVPGENVLRREAGGALAFGLSFAWDVDLKKEEQPGKPVQPTEGPR